MRSKPDTAMIEMGDHGQVRTAVEYLQNIEFDGMKLTLKWPFTLTDRFFKPNFPPVFLWKGYRTSPHCATYPTRRPWPTTRRRSKTTPGRWTTATRTRRRRSATASSRPASTCTGTTRPATWPRRRWPRWGLFCSFVDFLTVFDQMTQWFVVCAAVVEKRLHATQIGGHLQQHGPKLGGLRWIWDGWTGNSGAGPEQPHVGG